MKKKLRLYTLGGITSNKILMSRVTIIRNSHCVTHGCWDIPSNSARPTCIVLVDDAESYKIRKSLSRAHTTNKGRATHVNLLLHNTLLWFNCAFSLGFRPELLAFVLTICRSCVTRQLDRCAGVLLWVHVVERRRGWLHHHLYASERSVLQRFRHWLEQRIHQASHSSSQNQQGPPHCHEVNADRWLQEPDREEVDQSVHGAPEHPKHQTTHDRQKEIHRFLERAAHKTATTTYNKKLGYRWQTARRIFCRNATARWPLYDPASTCVILPNLFVLCQKIRASLRRFARKFDPRFLPFKVTQSHRNRHWPLITSY